MSEIGEAFFNALNTVTNVTKSQTADTGRYTYGYAPLGDVAEECKRALREQDLVYTQVPGAVEIAGQVMLALHFRLYHRNGDSWGFDPLIMHMPREAQPYGSALTYARRYQLLAIFNITPEDDDGAAATTAMQTQPGRRTEAERMIRESIAKMDDATKARFTLAFRQQFGTGLTDLPAARHGDALTWARTWQREEDADRQFVDEAKRENGAKQEGTDAENTA